MKIVIIEDEQHSAVRLQKLLTEIDPDTEVLAILDSIDSSLRWFTSNTVPDLIFQDIHLADGSGFEIYRTLQLDVPVIFTTAYDQYALDAFKVNSVDYLLKPVSKEQLTAGLDKFKRLLLSQEKPAVDYEKLVQKLLPDTYQSRFMVRYGQKIKVVEIQEIAYFYTFSGNTFFKTFDGYEYPSEFSLDKLEGMLEPATFFRINRQFIVHLKAIREMYSYSKSRVKIELNPPSDIETISSTDRSGKFKNWLSGR